MEEMIYDLKPAKRSFSRVGITLCVIFAVSFVGQLLWFLVPDLILGPFNDVSGSNWWMWLGTSIPLHFVAIPVGLLLLKPLPKEPPKQHKMGLKRFILFLPMIFCLMYAGNMVGNFLATLISGGEAVNALESLAMDNSLLKVVVMVVMAPLFEEYVFRKQIIDRTGRFGEKTAVVLSALCFGLFHMNLYQFFYAFALGLVFAYIYVRTGRLRYPIILHAIVNFMGSVVAPWILELVDLEALDAIATMNPEEAPTEILARFGDALPGLTVFMGYAMLLLGLSFAGFILLAVRWKKATWQEASAQLPKGTCAKTVYANMGMVLYLLLGLGMTVYTLFVQ